MSIQVESLASHTDKWVSVPERVCLRFGVFISLKDCICPLYEMKKGHLPLFTCHVKISKQRKKKGDFYLYLSPIFVRFLKIRCSFVIHENFLRKNKMKVWTVAPEPVLQSSVKGCVVNQYAGNKCDSQI